jgi:hypothetical protein
MNLILTPIAMKIPGFWAWIEMESGIAFSQTYQVFML